MLLPGQCFGMRNFVRVVTCPPEKVLRAALERLIGFCERHRLKTVELVRHSDVEVKVDHSDEGVAKKEETTSEIIPTDEVHSDCSLERGAEDAAKRARLS